MWKYLLFELHPGLVAILNSDKENISLKRIKKPNNFQRIFNMIFKKKKKEKSNNLNKNSNFVSWHVNEINNYASSHYEIFSKQEFTTWIYKLELSDHQKNLSEIISNFFDECQNNFLGPLISKQKKLSFRAKILIKNQIEKIEINMFPYLWKKKTRILFKCNNVDIQEEIFQLRELDKYKDNVLASVTHDLRTPLNIISFMTLQASNLKLESKELLRYLDIIKVNGDYLTSIISDILDYAQIKENKLRIIPTSFKIESLLNDIKNLFDIQAEAKGIHLIFKMFLQNDQQYINSDYKRLKQVIINLISNAFKFTIKGNVYLTVTEKKNLIRFEIKDTGVGMSKEIMEGLFKPFATFNRDKLNNNGIGLGLNICKKIIGYLGPEEKLFVTSEIEVGTRFSFYIKKNVEINNENIVLSTENWDNLEENEIKNESFNIPDDLISEKNDNDINVIYYGNNSKSKKIQYFNEKTQDKEEILNKKSLLKTDIIPQKKKIISILVVDDNVFNIMIFNEILANISDYFQFDISKAANGIATLEIFKMKNQKFSKSSIDLIVLDCEMPILDGFETAKRIRNLIKNEDYINCIIVGHTSYESEKEIKKCLNSGMDCILKKPTNTQELTEFLDNYF